MVKMDVRWVANAKQVERMNTQELRETFLLENLFVTGTLQLTYSDMDRIIVGSAVPTEQALRLEAPEQLLTDYFTEQRELGVANIGPA